LNIAVFTYEGEAAPWSAADAAWQRVQPDALDALLATTLLVLPDARTIPAASVDPIVRFVQRGGHLLAVGGPAFEQLVYRDPQGRMVAPMDYLATLPEEHALVDWAAVNAEPPRRATSQPQVPAEFTPLPDGYSARLAVVSPFGWDTRELPVTAIPAGQDTVLVRASGGERATSLVIELRERDGARWMGVAPLTAEERTVGIHLTQFAFWKDNSPAGRGGEGDMLRLDNVAAVTLGLASSHQILPEGAYTYTVRGLGTAKAGPGFVLASAPRLEGLSPSYKTFRSRVAKLETSPGWESLNLAPPADVVSPIARPRHEAPERDYIWQPLIKGLDTNGVWTTTPLATTWHASGATWTALGWRPSDAELDAIVRKLATMLAEGRQKVAAPALLADTAVNGPCVTVQNGRFMLDGKPWFAHAINYWPLYVSGMEVEEYFSGWAMPATYEPEYIDRDLDTLQTMGVNCVSIQYVRPAEAPRLRDFIARCATRGIKVNVFLSGAHPTSPSAVDDLSKRPFMELLQAADLKGNAGVFAYDLAWEPRLGLHKERAQFDPLFETWLIEQYGSVERAEAVWKRPANRVDGKLGGPTDAELKADGPHTPMVAAYRRFTDDLISRRYGEVVRLVRTLDDTHLCGARTGYGGTGTRGAVEVMQFALTAGAAHLDFTSPEGYGYGPENIGDAAFVGMFARWAGNGKPVFWAEFGRSVWNGGEDALALQAALYESFAEMAEKTQADGWAGWWFPGGYRVDERSDFGVVAPDRVLRPSSLVLQRTAPTLKDIAPYAAFGQSPLEIRPEEHAAGLAALVDEFSERSAAAFKRGALPEVRTPGSHTLSTDCPLTGVGGMPYESPMPPQYLNADIVTEFRNGRWTVTAVNTGEAAWVAGDCALLVEGEDGEQRAPLSGKIAQFEAARFEVNAPKSGKAVLCMTAGRFGKFGQRTDIKAGD
jgi:hypothetical protein